MLDFKLNKAIAMGLGISFTVNNTLKAVFFIRDDESTSREFDFNDWNDLINLAIEYDVYYQIDKHLTARRLAESLLKVLESKNA